MLEVYKILKGFEGTDEMTFFQRRLGSTRGHDLKLFKKRVKLDVGNLASEIEFVTSGTGCQSCLSMLKV